MGFAYLGLLVLLVAISLIVALRRRSSPRTVMALLAAIVLTYLLLVVLPYFAYGMHLQDPAQVAGGNFDPKGYPLFQSDTLTGDLFHFVALLLCAVTPIAIVSLGLRLLVSLFLWRRQSEVMATWQPLSASLILVSVAVFAFMWTPMGRVMLAWHFD